MQKYIDSYDFAGKKAIVRVDFNVPLDENFKITDDTRIRAAIPTLKKVLQEGGSVIIMSHLGRPKGVNPKFSLKHIVDHVSEKLGVPVQFAEDCQKADAQAAALKPGEALLLENLRFYAEEEGKPRGLAEDATDEEKKAAKAAVKESQKEFVKKLASYADCYINDAFGTAHRAHASTALIAKYFPDDKMFGYLMEGEIKAIDNVLHNAQKPLTAIIGGAKVSSKLAVLKNLLGKVDNLIIGGGMGYTFIKAQGGKIGLSLHEDELMPDALAILEEAKAKGVNVYISDQA
ncbi:MAG: phosphoglycerate kinase, partial [Bacteroidales bacterium]|nr:phosphoglycerate kinase [Bacteroidales bacterium]